MSSIDQQFVEYIVKSLVGNPDAVEIARRIDEKGVLLELSVDPEDLGRVIGKRGATAQSLRTLLRALGTKNDARYNLKIVDPTGGSSMGGGGSTTDDSPADDAVVATVSTAASADDADAEPPEDAAEEPSDNVKKTRRELADLDDLDI